MDKEIRIPGEQDLNQEKEVKTNAESERRSRIGKNDSWSCLLGFPGPLYVS